MLVDAVVPGSMCVGICSVSPSLTMTARATRFSSSRTLPLMSTVASVGATCSIASSARRSASEAPTMSPKNGA